MPKKTKKVEFKDKRKITAYYAPKHLTMTQDELKAENRTMGYKPEKSHSDLLVTLDLLWHKNTAVRDLVRAEWAGANGG